MKKFFLFCIILCFSISLNARAEEKQKKWPMIFFRSYIKTIKNSVYTGVYKNLYYRVAGEKVDVLKNGDLSCAYFTSSILYHFKLISDWHTSVKITVEDMKKSGWYSIKKPRVGSVIVWARVNRNKHIGFYIGKGWAMSNSSKSRRPIKHHWRKHSSSNKRRKVVKILWHPKLETEAKK